MNKFAITMLVLSAAILTPGAAGAAEFQHCVRIAKAEDRLACFDKFAAEQTAEMKVRTTRQNSDPKPFVDKHITDQVAPATKQ